MARFTAAQVEAHAELEAQWWQLDLTSEITALLSGAALLIIALALFLSAMWFRMGEKGANNPFRHPLSKADSITKPNTF